MMKRSKSTPPTQRTRVVYINSDDLYPGHPGYIYHLAESAKKSVHEMNKVYANEEQTLNGLVEKYSYIGDKYDSLKSKYHDLEDSYEQLERDVDQKTQIIHEKNENLDKLCGHLETLQSDYEAIDEYRKKICLDYEELKQEKESQLVPAMERLQEKIAEYEDKLSQCANEINDLIKYKFISEYLKNQNENYLDKILKKHNELENQVEIIKTRTDNYVVHCHNDKDYQSRICDYEKKLDGLYEKFNEFNSINEKFDSLMNLQSITNSALNNLNSHEVNENTIDISDISEEKNLCRLSDEMSEIKNIVYDLKESLRLKLANEDECNKKDHSNASSFVNTLSTMPSNSDIKDLDVTNHKRNLTLCPGLIKYSVFRSISRVDESEGVIKVLTDDQEECIIFTKETNNEIYDELICVYDLFPHDSLTIGTEIDWDEYMHSFSNNLEPVELNDSLKQRSPTGVEFTLTKVGNRLQTYCRMPNNFSIQRKIQLLTDTCLVLIYAGVKNIRVDSDNPFVLCSVKTFIDRYNSEFGTQVGFTQAVDFVGDEKKQIDKYLEKMRYQNLESIQQLEISRMQLK